MELIKFEGYTALIREDDANDLKNKDMLNKLTNAGIKLHVLPLDEVICMMLSIGINASGERIWPKGTCYLMPPTGPIGACIAASARSFKG